MSIFVNTSQWIVNPSPPEEFVALVRKNFSAEGGSAPGGQVSISQFQLLAQLLWSTGLKTEAEVDKFLKKVGAEYSVFIPDRFKEAYGLSMARIDEFHGLGAKVIVTIDCGVTDFNEIEKAKENCPSVI